MWTSLKCMAAWKAFHKYKTQLYIFLFAPTSRYSYNSDIIQLHTKFWANTPKNTEANKT